MAITNRTSESVRSHHPLCLRQRPHTNYTLCPYALHCVSMIPCKWRLQTVLLWQLYMVVSMIRRKQCHCMSEGSMLLSWNAKRRRQDYESCMCGDSRGCPMSSGDKQAIRVTHRVHAELWTSGPQLVTSTIPLATWMITGLWKVGMGLGPITEWPLCAVPT